VIDWAKRGFKKKVSKCDYRWCVLGLKKERSPQEEEIGSKGRKTADKRRIAGKKKQLTTLIESVGRSASKKDVKKKSDSRFGSERRKNVAAEGRSKRATNAPVKERG